MLTKRRRRRRHGSQRHGHAWGYVQVKVIDKAWTNLLEAIHSVVMYNYDNVVEIEFLGKYCRCMIMIIRHLKEESYSADSEFSRGKVLFLKIYTIALHVSSSHQKNRCTKGR